jgi:superfamily II DNA or RNA helicase
MFKQIRLLPDNYLGVSFTYNPAIVLKLKKLGQRRWNPDEKRWEVHLSHLPEILEILAISERNIPRDVQMAYQKAGWERGGILFTLGNSYSTIAGSNLPLDALDEATSFKVPGAEFNANYKKGEWDGQRHLMKRGPSTLFPSGLLERIREILDGMKSEYRCEEKRPKPRRTLSFDLAGPEPRDYQKQAIAAACKASRGILQMATGSGKTLVAAHIIATLRCKTFFFVHTRDLLRQACDVFESVLGCEVGRVGDGCADFGPVTVAMVQTCARAFGITVKDEGDADESGDLGKPVSSSKYRTIVKEASSARLAIFDECHHLPADTFYKLCMELSSAYFRFGLSATPYRADQLDLLLEAALGRKIYVINSSALIDKGYLVPPTIRFIGLPPIRGNTGNMTYQEIYSRAIVENETRNRIICQEAAQYGSEQLTVLVLVQQIRHGEMLASQLPGATLLTGSVSSSIRQDVLDQLRRREINIVIATTLADEGLDIPTLDVLILAGGGKSETRALQRVGRSLRQSGEKTKAIVVDFAHSDRYLLEHSSRRLKIYQTEPRFKIEFDRSHAPIPTLLEEVAAAGLFSPDST